MTVKQLLLEYVASLSEEEALSRAESLLAAGFPAPLTPEQIDSARRGLADLAAGKKHSHGDVLRRVKP